MLAVPVNSGSSYVEFDVDANPRCMRAVTGIPSRTDTKKSHTSQILRPDGS
jgi:hypothetical protein